MVYLSLCALSLCAVAAVSELACRSRASCGRDLFTSQDFDMLPHSFCVDSSSPQISAIHLGHFTRGGLPNSPQNFCNNCAEKCKTPGSQNSLSCGVLFLPAYPTCVTAIADAVPWSASACVSPSASCFACASARCW